MFGRTGFLSEWLREYCSPVVITIATAEAENICYKNGVLLHELLGVFGHLDGVNASIKTPGSQTFNLTDAHIRFERSTEAKPKSSQTIDELLKSSFEECNLDRLPSTVSELKGSPPTSWNHKIEQIIYMRSLSFSEYEMLSSPVILLSVVSSADVDPVMCMQELLSTHHTPITLTSGQYESEVYRIYLLLHDASTSSQIDASSIYRRLQSKFPSGQTKLLIINSLPPNQPNLQQPDLWTKYSVPLCFPQSIPTLLPVDPASINGENGSVVLGSRLSIEDFMTLRNFCMNLFVYDVVPVLERRIAILTRAVNETRKGVKNVLKSFWRKPRDEAISPSSSPKSSQGLSIRYRYDRIETQILLLADISFIIKDYETALSMYKLVRDDYKADKSNFHLAHTYIMIALCYFLAEPHRVRDVQSQLEAIAQILPLTSELPHITAYFALLVSEIYNSKDYRQYLDSAQLLLQVSGSLSKYPILCALLTEKAASSYLIGGFTRRYILHETLAGHKLRSVGGKPAKHAVMNFASALFLLDETKWGDMKVKLCRAIGQELRAKYLSSIKNKNIDNNESVVDDDLYRSLISILNTLTNVLNEESNIGNKESLIEGTGALDELLEVKFPVISNAESKLLMSKDWRDMNVHQLLVIKPPVSQTIDSSTLFSTAKNVSALEISDFSYPDINIPRISLMMAFNGVSSLVPWDGNTIPSNPIANTITYSVENSSSVTQDSLGDEIVDHAVSSNNVVKSILVPSLQMFHKAEDLKYLLDVENLWANEIASIFTSVSMDSTSIVGSGDIYINNSSINNNALTIRSTLGSKWIEAEAEITARKNRFMNRNFQSYVSATLSCVSATSVYGANIPNVLSCNSSIAQYPIGELIILRVQMRNKLPTSINITSFYVDIYPQEDFEVFPIDFVLASRESKEVFVSIKALKLGKYAVNSIKYNLSNEISIQRNIQKPGMLLQKTQVQRIEGIRGEDISLKFEVIKPHPLIEMSFQCIPEEILQGELVKASLILRNDSFHASACNIYVKLSHPCIVFSEKAPENLIDLFGQSCTVWKLPSDIVIVPQEEYHLTAWLRFSSIGKHNISVLASYEAYNNQAVESALIVTPDYVNGSIESKSVNSSFRVSSLPNELSCRTSYVNLPVTVIPSVSLSVQWTSKLSSSDEKNIFVELSNNIPLLNPNSPQAVVGTSFDDQEQHANTKSSSDVLDALMEGSCMIDSIVVLGGVSVTLGRMNCQSIDNSPYDLTKQNKLLYIVNQSEMLSIPMEMKITDETCDDVVNNRIVNTSSIQLPPHLTVNKSSGNTSNFTEAVQRIKKSKKQSLQQLKGLVSFPIKVTSESTTLSLFDDIIRIQERFVCMSLASQLFKKDIREAEYKSYYERLEGSDAPKTISQVRKDRQKELTTFTDDFEDDIELEQGVNSGMETIDISDNQSPSDANNRDNVSDNEVSKSPYTILNQGYPVTLAEYAQYSAQNLNISVMVSWRSKYQGKIRQGMHFVNNISLLGNQSSRYIESSSPSTIVAATQTNMSTNVNSSRLSVVKRSKYDSNVSNGLSPSAINLTDYLLVGIQHVERVFLPQTSLLSNRGVVVPVYIELKSICNVAMLVHVEVIDRKDRKDPSTPHPSNPSSVGTNNHGGNIMEDYTGAIAKSSSRGFQWQCKTKYYHNILKPFSKLVLPFQVHISNAGIFDLKRLKIAACYYEKSHNSVGTNHSSQRLYYKDLHGQSLIEAVDVPSV